MDTTIGYALSPAMNKSLFAALVKLCTCGGDSLFHSSYDGVVAREMLPTQSILHRPEQMKVRRRQIRTIRWVWYDIPVKIDNVLHGLQTGWGLALSCCKRKVVFFFFGLTLVIRAFSLVSVAM